MENNETSTTTVVRSILQQYLSKYAPADIDTSTTLKTSQEIVEELSEVMEVTINEVASILAENGYKIIHSRNGRLGWAMKLNLHADK